MREFVSTQLFIDWIAQMYSENTNDAAKIAFQEFVTVYPEYRDFLNKRIKFHGTIAIECAVELCEEKF